MRRLFTAMCNLKHQVDKFQILFQMREQFVTHLQENLDKNLTRCKTVDPPTRDLNIGDMFHAAIEIEYEVFTVSKVRDLYRKSIAKLVSFHLDGLVIHFFFHNPVVFENASGHREVGYNYQ